MTAVAAVALDGAVLHPRPWVLQEPPPLPPPPWPEPLVLQINHRQPLPPAVPLALEASLSAAEREHHAALRRPADQQRFLLARGGLRLLLAAWQDCSADAVRIEVGDHGKPHCPGGPAFNLSHSGDLILLALHPRWPVGVDLEKLRPGLDWEPIARRVLTEPQCQALNGLPAPARMAGFLAQWCALEAELKAAGTGFSGLERWRSEAHRGGESLVQRWRLRLPDGYLGAVVLLMHGSSRLLESAKANAER